MNLDSPSVTYPPPSTPVPLARITQARVRNCLLSGSEGGGGAGLARYIGIARAARAHKLSLEEKRGKTVNIILCEKNTRRTLAVLFSSVFSTSGSIILYFASLTTLARRLISSRCQEHRLVTLYSQIQNMYVYICVYIHKRDEKMKGTGCDFGTRFYERMKSILRRKI